jgi:hypothetical protein
VQMAHDYCLETPRFCNDLQVRCPVSVSCVAVKSVGMCSSPFVGSPV